ncbi:hypothetical protein B566_EDAN003782, partial [Ephemera danica]
MEFDFMLTKIQGTLLSLEKTFGSLKSLKFGDDDTKTVTETIRKVIEENAQGKEENTRRKLHFYLVLNTDFPVQEDLYENNDIVHLVATAPTLSQDLLVSIVHDCGLHMFAYEVVTYGEPALSLQYLEALQSHFIKLEAKQMVVESLNFASAIFLRIVRLLEGFETCNSTNLKFITTKFYKSLRSLILGIPPTVAKIIPLTDVELVGEISGQVTKNMISLLIKCMGHMDNPTPLDWYPQPSLETYDYSQWGDEKVKILECLDFVVDECKKNMETVTVQLWLHWEECDGAVDEGKSLQTEIAEEAYICTRMSHTYSTPSLANLMGILLGFERKPKDENDEIQDANLDTILLGIEDESKSQSIWLEALLKRNDSFATEKALLTIQKNLGLFTQDTTAMLMNRAIVGNSANDDLLKSIAFDAFKQTTEQLKILEDFFTQNNLNDFFKCNSFHNDVTSFLNRSAKFRNEPKKEFLNYQDERSRKKEWVPELLCLCLQSPQEFIRRIVVSGIASRGQANLMRVALSEIRPICQLQMVGVNADADISDIPLLLHSLSDIMSSLDPATSQITYLVLQLEEEKLVDKVQFIKVCLLPALKQDLSDYKVQRIQIWLQLLGKLLHVDSTVSARSALEGLNLALILAMLAEVLQRASWVLGKFRQQESLLRADTVSLIRPLACRMANTSAPDDTDLLWLRAGLLKLTSHNRSHFSTLWTHFNLPVPSMNLGALLLSRDAMCMQQNLPHGGPDQLLSPLLILLPTCCTPEWRLLASSLSFFLSDLACQNRLEGSQDEDEEDGQGEDNMMHKVLRLLVTTLMLQTLMLSQQQSEDPSFSNDCAMACLENSVRNLGIIMK